MVALEVVAKVYRELVDEVSRNSARKGSVKLHCGATRYTVLILILYNITIVLPTEQDPIVLYLLYM